MNRKFFLDNHSQIQPFANELIQNILELGRQNIKTKKTERQYDEPTKIQIEQTRGQEDMMESQAKMRLMSVDWQEFDRPQNSSQIARWLNQRPYIQSKCLKIHKKKRNLTGPRNSLSENGAMGQNINLEGMNIGIALKKRLNRLAYPLQQQGNNSNKLKTTYLDKQKTEARSREDVKLDIINSKPEISSILSAKKKLSIEVNCENGVIKPRLYAHYNYQKIKRKGFFALDDTRLQHQINITSQLTKTRDHHSKLNTLLDTTINRQATHRFATLPIC